MRVATGISTPPRTQLCSAVTKDVLQKLQHMSHYRNHCRNEMDWLDNSNVIIGLYRLKSSLHPLILAFMD